MQPSVITRRADFRVAGGACPRRAGNAMRRLNAGRFSPQKRDLRSRAQREGGSAGDFVSGFLLGGAVFGTLGFVFAPQISRALLDDQNRLRLPRFLEESSPETTKADLSAQIEQINQLMDKLQEEDRAAAAAEPNSATPEKQIQSV